MVFLCKFKICVFSKKKQHVFFAKLRRVQNINFNIIYLAEVVKNLNQTFNTIHGRIIKYLDNVDFSVNMLALKVKLLELSKLIKECSKTNKKISNEILKLKGLKL